MISPDEIPSLYAMLEEQMISSLRCTRKNETGPAKDGITNDLSSHELKGIYQNELFFCEILAFEKLRDPKETAEKRVEDLFRQLNLPLNKLVLNDSSFFNVKDNTFADTQWHQFFAAQYIFHVYYLQSDETRMKNVKDWLTNASNETFKNKIMEFTQKKINETKNVDSTPGVLSSPVLNVWCLTLPSTDPRSKINLENSYIQTHLKKRQ